MRVSNYFWSTKKMHEFEDLIWKDVHPRAIFHATFYQKSPLDFVLYINFQHMT